MGERGPDDYGIRQEATKHETIKPRRLLKRRKKRRFFEKRTQKPEQKIITNSVQQKEKQEVAPQVVESNKAALELQARTRKELTTVEHTIPRALTLDRATERAQFPAELFYPSTEDKQKLEKNSSYTGDNAYKVFDHGIVFGRFEAGKPCEGTLAYKDGSLYHGQLNAAGKPEGKGYLRKELLRPDPDNSSQMLSATYEYIGDFVDGKRQGAGIYKRPNASTISCTRQDNYPASSTQAHMTYVNRDPNKPVEHFTGTVTTTLSNSDFPGVKKREVSKNGHGSYSCDDGSRFVGNRVDSTVSGPGTLYLSGNRPVIEGQRQHGALLLSSLVDTTLQQNIISNLGQKASYTIEELLTFPQQTAVV